VGLAGLDRPGGGWPDMSRVARERERSGWAHPPRRCGVAWWMALNRGRWCQGRGTHGGILSPNEKIHDGPCQTPAPRLPLSRPRAWAPGVCSQQVDHDEMPH
jgi:hypothetical protein